VGTQETKPRVQERQNPLDASRSPETISLVDEYLLLRQQVKALLSPYKPEIKVFLPAEGPYKVVHTGDNHYGHDNADPSSLQEAVDETGAKGILITQGNVIEAVSGKFIFNNTTKVGLDLDEQELIVSAILHPVDKNKRYVPVSGNMCHDGWSRKTATHDPIRGMVSPTTQVLLSGGQVIFERGGKEIGRMEPYHNPGQGRTKQSPEGALRARYREVPVGVPDHPDEVVGAHTHQLTAGQDVIHDPITNEDVVIALGNVGAAKGTKQNSDGFLIGLGVPPRDQPADAGRGFVTIIKDKPEGIPSFYPVAGYERARVLFQAEQLWENAQRTGAVRELKEHITSLHSPPNKEFNSETSLTRLKDPAAKAEGDAPLYKSLDWTINTDLPVRVQFMGNLRIPAESFDRTRVLDILKDIEGDPWAYYFATRRLVAQGTAQRSDRNIILQDLAHVLGEAKTSLLGVMITDDLRNNAWGKKRKGENGDDPSPILRPSDWLYQHANSDIRGTPMMTSETVARLQLGDMPYTLYIRDRLAHLTSLINPFHGLTRISQIWGIQADVLVGGNTEGIGWRTWMRPWGQLEVVVPGGFSEYVEKGIGNRVDYAEGGQGVIFFPDNRMIFSGATADDVRDMHEALWMWDGLRQEKTLTKTMRQLEKTKKTRRGQD